MPSKFDAALAQARAAGHEMEHDPPHALASVDRYTCKHCGKAVLGNFTVAYGSALEGECAVRVEKLNEEGRLLALQIRELRWRSKARDVDAQVAPLRERLEKVQLEIDAINREATQKEKK